MNHRGQSSIEAVIAALALIILIQALLVIVYFSSLKLFLDYRSHESMVCATQNSPALCRQLLKSDIERFLAFGKIENLSLSKSKQKISVFVVLKFSILRSQYLWKFKDDIALPLKF